MYPNPSLLLFVLPSNNRKREAKVSSLSRDRTPRDFLDCLNKNFVYCCQSNFEYFMRQNIWIGRSSSFSVFFIHFESKQSSNLTVLNWIWELCFFIDRSIWTCTLFVIRLFLFQFELLNCDFGLESCFWSRYNAHFEKPDFRLRINSLSQISAKATTCNEFGDETKEYKNERHLNLESGELRQFEMPIS